MRVAHRTAKRFSKHPIPCTLSGNFWWATASYIQTLKPPGWNNADRMEAERFIGTVSWKSAGHWSLPPKILCLFDSGTSHYRIRFLPSRYLQDSTFRAVANATLGLNPDPPMTVSSDDSLKCAAGCTEFKCKRMP